MIVICRLENQEGTTVEEKAIEVTNDGGFMSFTQNPFPKSHIVAAFLGRYHNSVTYKLDPAPEGNRD